MSRRMIEQGHPAGCGCGAHGGITMAARARVEVVGADGRPYLAPRPLQGVEVFVAWADNADVRARIEADLTAALDAIAEEHRREARRVLDRGADPAALSRLSGAYADRYTDAIVGAAERMRDAVADQTVDEAIRQARSAAPAPMRPGSTRTAAGRLQDVAGQAIERLMAGAQVAGAELANRVQGEAVRWWMTGASWGGFVPEVNVTLPARQVLQTVESEGRAWVAAEMETTGIAGDLGLEIVEVVRTSVNDMSRCARCSEMDGATYAIPADLARFEREPTPDPECFGGAERCRCGFLVVWGARGDT